MSRPIFASPDAAARLLGGQARDSGRAEDDELRGRQPRAVRSALQVLECVAASGAGVTAQEISRVIGLSRATTYRLVQLLVEDEYLVRLPDLSGFALGRRVAALAPPVAPRPPRAARDVLERLRGGVRGGIHLVRLDGTVPVVADEDPDFPLATGPELRELLDRACGELATSGTTVRRGTQERVLLAAAVVDEETRPVAALVLLVATARLPDPALAFAALEVAAAELGPLLT